MTAVSGNSGPSGHEVWHRGVLVLGVPALSLPNIEPVRHEVAPICVAPPGRCKCYAFSTDQREWRGSGRAPDPDRPFCRSHWHDLCAAARGIQPSANVVDGRGCWEYWDPPPEEPEPVLELTFPPEVLAGVDEFDASLLAMFQRAWVTVACWPNPYRDDPSPTLSVFVHPAGARIIVRGSYLWTLE
jgi:hypothetical protein